MSEWGIGVGDVIKGFGEKLKKEREEVKRLREELAQTRACLWWCYDLKRFGNEMKDEDWDFIGRLLGADTDHNDNAWEGEKND